MSKFDAVGGDIVSSPTDDKSQKEEELFNTPVDEKKEEILSLRKEQVQGLRKRVDHYQQLYDLRKNVAIFIFVLISFWLLCVMGLVFFGSFDVHYFQGQCGNLSHSWFENVKSLPEKCAYIKQSTFLNLSESIVIALITTTTANVLGLSYIVAKWLFPKPESDDIDVTVDDD